jgi:hypothetical protein
MVYPPCENTEEAVYYSVAKGTKFRPQNTKWAEKNCVGPGKFGAELLADLLKRAEKEPNFLQFGFALKTVIFLSENCSLPLIYSMQFPLLFSL